jgi:hypothetical protein
MENDDANHDSPKEGHLTSDIAGIGAEDIPPYNFSGGPSHDYPKPLA